MFPHPLCLVIYKFIFVSDYIICCFSRTTYIITMGEMFVRGFFSIQWHEKWSLLLPYAYVLTKQIFSSFIQLHYSLGRKSWKKLCLSTKYFDGCQGKQEISRASQRFQVYYLTISHFCHANNFFSLFVLSLQNNFCV